MDESKKPFRNRLNEQLPTHSPDPGLWESLSSQLDMIDANAALQENLAKLPVHSPDQGTWNGIVFRLNRIAYYKTGLRVALSAAAGLLLFFTVARLIETNQTSLPPQSVAVSPDPAYAPSTAVVPSSPVIAPLSRTVSTKPGLKTNLSVNDDAVSGTNAALPEATHAVLEQPSVMLAENNVADPSGIPATEMTIAEQEVQIQNQNETQQVVAENYNINTGPRIIPPADEYNKTYVNQAEKYYPSGDPENGKNKNYFALTMNYLPENVYNGSENTVFHNVDLTASFNKEKVRYNTSLGMAYNEDQFEFFVNYDVNTPVTAPGPGGKIDTISYTVSNMDSEYQGTEKHQYITYNLGLGKRLFSAGKFSSWINAGAGFGIQINNPDLIAATAQSIQGQPNAQINSVNSDKALYSDYNINFVTGIDFNYQIIKRLSISFAPTSRWYFKPLITKNNQPTDELSLGFRTGMKFNF